MTIAEGIASGMPRPSCVHRRHHHAGGPMMEASDEVCSAAVVRCYGYSALCRTIISISGPGGGEDVLCYAASRHVVLHDLLAKRQHFFAPAHRDAVTHLAASSDGSVLASAESGAPSQVSVWDTAKLRRIAKVSCLHGVAGLLLCPDGTRLAILHRSSEEGQELSLWEISNLAQEPNLGPLCTGMLANRGLPSHTQICARWTAPDCCVLATTGSQSVGFWTMTADSHCTPVAVSPADLSLGQPITTTTTAFMPDRDDQAASGTLSGDVVLWQRTPGAACAWKAVKQVPIHMAGICYLVPSGGLLYCGFSDGRARAYDSRLRLAAWAETPKGAAVVAIAVLAGRASISGDTAAAVPDVIVSLASGLCLRLPQTAYDATEDPSTRAKAAAHAQVLLQQPREIIAIATHPLLPLLAVTSGQDVVLWDHVWHDRVCARDMRPSGLVTALCFGHKNSWLAVGTAAGNIIMLSADTLETLYDLSQSKKPTKMLATDSGGRLLAAATAGDQVMLFAWKPSRQRFAFAGSCMAAAPVVALCFGEDPAGRMRLLSLGADNSLVEFDIEFHKPEPGLRAVSSTTVCSDAGASPSAFTFAPPQPYYDQGCSDALVLLATTDSKLRVFRLDPLTCVAICNGPRDCGRILQMVSYRGPGIRDHGHIAFRTSQGHLGFMMWPVTGDPADFCIQRVLPVGDADAVIEPSVPMAFTAHGRTVVLTCPVSDVVLELEARLSTSVPLDEYRNVVKTGA